MNEMKEIKMNPDGVMEKIIWKPIKGYEGYYIINQFGDVKRLKVMLTRQNGRKYEFPEKIVTTTVMKKRGDYVTRLRSTSGIRKIFVVRRLVAEAFLNLDRKSRKVVTYHLDDDYSNLYYKNIGVSTTKEFYPRVFNGSSAIRLHAVKCITKKGEEFVFDSITTATEYFDISRGIIKTHINKNKVDPFGNIWNSATKKS